MSRLSFLTIKLLLLSSVLVCVGVLVCANNRWEQRAVFVRPDGHYRLVVMRQRPLFFAMPGQAGDASGKMLIQDQNGKVLFRHALDMVQTVDAVEWGTCKVSVKLQGEWLLPD
ncbi:MAG: hypothetical protein PHD48_03675 [Alphaproteobacteria bacterium]|nr:hypothetical protein [Alphaproteobacteria bacterium]